MIYLGFIHFNDERYKAETLSTILESYTLTSPTIIKKGCLTLCYGKNFPIQDIDETFDNESMILMGRIFAKERQDPFGKNEFKKLHSQDKENILKKIWGKYVFLRVNEANPSVEIVIDSTGQLPFFYYQFSNGDILFSSNIELIYKVLRQKSKFNWSYLCSYVIYGSRSAIQTPFEEVFELPPGCCLKITKNDRKTELFWQPLDFYKTPLIRQENDVVNILQFMLNSLIAPYQNICVSLSGGLDSSSLMYCLKDIVKDHQILTAINFFHGSIKSSNELVHARKVCEDTGVHLIEIDVSNSLPFDPVNRKLYLNYNKPFPGLTSLRWQENVYAHIPSKGSSVFLSGHGSDHIFMRPPTKKSLADYILEKGLKGTLTQLKNITDYYRNPIFTIFKENMMSFLLYHISCKLQQHPTKIKDQMPEWINPTLHQKASPHYAHPFYDNLPKKVLPGKYEQINALYTGVASIHMETNPSQPTHYPFLYSPIVEFALSFPTYDLFNRGYDRYPLRRSVSDRFQTETVWRRDKSQTTGLFQLGVKKNLKHVLELCLEGVFYKHGLIDKDYLYNSIILIGNGENKYLWPFIHLASAEIFLNSWEGK